MLYKILMRRAGSFFAPNAQLHLRNQTAEILVSSARSNQQRKPGFTAQRWRKRSTSHFRSNMHLEPNLFRRKMKTRRPVYSIPVEQCHRRHTEVRAHSDQFLRNRRPFEEAEGRTGMKFNVHQRPTRRFVIPSAARDLQFAARCRSLAPLGMTIYKECCCSPLQPR